MIQVKLISVHKLNLNPLAEIQQEAEAKDKGDGHIGTAYRKACRSIQACPIPYNNINELLCLQYVGKVMVAKLEKKQKEYYAAMGMDVPAAGGGGGDSGPEARAFVEAQETSARKGKGKKRADGARGRRETDDTDDDGMGENSAFAARLQAGGGSELTCLVHLAIAVLNHSSSQVIGRLNWKRGEPRGKDWQKTARIAMKPLQDS